MFEEFQKEKEKDITESQPVKVDLTLPGELFHGALDTFLFSQDGEAGEEWEFQSHFGRRKRKRRKLFSDKMTIFTMSSSTITETEPLQGTW